MIKYDKELLLKSLLMCEAVKFGDFTLASGKKSKYYIDIKKASTDPTTLSLIADSISLILKERMVDIVGGVALGGVPLATAVSLKSKLPLLIIRKDNKGYGTGGRFIGNVKKKSHIILVEDVTTSGGSAKNAIVAIREAGGIVDTVIVVVDREEDAKQNIESLNVEFISLLSASDILKNEKNR